MTAGNRKNPYRPNYTGQDLLAKKKNGVFVVFLMLTAIIGILLGASVGKANAYGPSPIRQAQCTPHGAVAGLQSELSKGVMTEFWCQPDNQNLTFEITVGNTHEEVRQLLKWHKLAPYDNTRLFCKPRTDKAWIITDLEDYNKSGSIQQQDRYNAWATAYATRNNCRSKG